MRSLEEVLEAHGPLPLYRPDGTLSELNEMQKEDINKLALMGRVLGDLPVGYGKTAIATCVSLMLRPPVTLILVPPILVAQWVKWLQSIHGAGRVVRYEGSPKKRAELQLRGARFVVASYQIFKNDFERLRAELQEPMTIVDECQNLKNYKSQLFKRVKELSDDHPLLLMSGTIMSKPGDGYAYVKLNDPGVYRTYAMFENIHVAKRDFFDQPVEWRNLDLLQQNLDLSRVRRTKEEVHANLPAVNWLVIEYDLHPEHMKLYRKLMDEQLLEVEDGKIDATTAGKLYAAAQQIITNWDYYSDNPDNKSRVLELVDEVLDELGFDEPVMPGEERSKLILWTNYQRTSGRVLRHLNERGSKASVPWRAVGAYGAVNSKEGVRAFMEDPDALELTAQPGSAGAGLNPQGFCWEMGFIEMPTTTVPFVQCCGRIDRTGQRFNPTIRLFVARNTIQQALMRNLFDNDALVHQAGGTKQRIKDLIFPS